VRGRRFRPGPTTWLLAVYSGAAALVAAPWYIKNWLWLGSPVWPFLTRSVTSGLPSDADQYFLRHMHGGRTMLDYLLLPFRIYLDGSVEYPGAIPPYILLLAPLYVLVRKQRLVTYLLALSAVHVVVWSQGLHVLRYLMPIYPALCLVAAHVLARMMSKARPQVVTRPLLSALVVLSVVPGLIVLESTLRDEQPFGQLVGLESREAYLSRALPDYGAVRYLNEHRAEVNRALIIGAARLFYLDPPVLIDGGLDVAEGLRLTSEPSDALAGLQGAGISHVMVSLDHLVFLARFDPEQRVVRWLQDFERVRPGYLVREYRDDAVSVYRVTGAVAERIQP
jgi:hypothetical protein